MLYSQFRSPRLNDESPVGIFRSWYEKNVSFLLTAYPYFIKQILITSIIKKWYKKMMYFP